MTINTDMFFYEKDDKVFHQEASTLGWDAIPHMFTLESHWTGRKLAMELKETRRDPEGEIMHWEFKCNIEPSITVMVFND